MHYSGTHGCLHEGQSEGNIQPSIHTHFVDILAFKDAISNIILVMEGTNNWNVLLKK